EIGRAQAMQAAAAGIEPEAALNPVLLKPGGNGTSQVIVLGKPVAEADAMSYPALKPRLADTVLACLTGLADRFDVVVCEGAGSGGGAGPGGDLLRVAVVRLPRISNFTDTDPLAAEPDVALRFVTSPAEIADADLVILPGSRATVADLAWLRERGLAGAVAA